MRKPATITAFLLVIAATLVCLFSCGSVPPVPAPAQVIPPDWEDEGIFSAFYEKSYDMLATMTLEEKIGQMLLVRCPHEDAPVFIKDYQPGGFVLFGIDFQGETAAGISDKIEAYQNCAKIPMIMAVDEEGGNVVRISANPNLASRKFMSPQEIYSSGGLKAVTEDTLNKASLLKNLGLNLNLAPVADVSTNPNDFIYPRTLGRSAQETGDYTAAVVTAMHQMSLSSALKHFPGYGDNADTHTGIAEDNRPYSSFISSDFIPFERGIEAGAESVMVCHNIVNCMERGVPASLSPAVHQLLRITLKFTGVIITDDLSMDAIASDAGIADPAVSAVPAGNDMLLLRDGAAAADSINAAVKAGDVPVGLIDHAVFRILAWKLSRGIIAD